MKNEYDSGPFNGLEGDEMSVDAPSRKVDMDNLVFMVEADHPAFQRPDKMFGTREEADEYAKGLAEFDFENINVREIDTNECIR